MIFPKRNSSSKGQAAMEFLMTYGWAILIVIIAIGALYALGVFSGGGGTNCKMDPPFACIDMVVTAAAGGDQLVVTAQGIGGGATVSVAGGCTAAATPVPNNVQTTIALTCPGVSSGDRVQGTLTGTYKLVTSPLSKTATGTWSTVAQ